ncbi:hypothetical protein B0A50_03947 [Salinomyces thailandicus]|uniref:NAD(P)-binding protein n=1 Tax=Salinomyces thailandicus TaxID=706561 RepID=A0A4U0U0S2_9PEZI|nr:hypothetical protein B0A50_03947 [Salinomyces thailandica]
MLEMLNDLYTTAQLYGRLLRDIIISLIFIWTGALLPKLHVPDRSLDGKTAIVTGANSGIGYQISLDLAKRGATVYLACRNASKGQEAADVINQQVKRSATGDVKGVRAHVAQLDTSSIDSVRKFTKTWAKDQKGRSIDILVHNAGISSAPEGGDVTEEGLGMIYATNFLGSFALTALLEPKLASGARVVFTSAVGQYAGTLNGILTSPCGVPKDGLLDKLLVRKMPDSQHYSNTKLMQVAFARTLQRRWNQKPFASKALTAHAFMPGYVFTPIFSKTASLPIYVDPVWWFLKALTFLSISVEQGAATGVWLSTTSDLEVRRHGGSYWDRMTRRMTPVDVMDSGVLERLWQCWERDAGVEWKAA